MHGSCVCHRGFILRSELGQNYVSFIVTKSVCVFTTRESTLHNDVSLEFDVSCRRRELHGLSPEPRTANARAPARLGGNAPERLPPAGCRDGPRRRHQVSRKSPPCSKQVSVEDLPIDDTR